jgi:chaperonin GroEL
LGVNQSSKLLNISFQKRCGGSIPSTPAKFNYYFMPKQVYFKSEARPKLIEGVSDLLQAVGSTLGPKGQNVIIETPYGATTVTKDGVTVAKHFEASNKAANLAASIIKQAASRSASIAGDGTTSATVLASNLYLEGVKLKHKEIDIKRRYEELLSQSLKHLEELSTPTTPEHIVNIATVSSNNDTTIGDLIYRAFDYVGPLGVVTIEDSKTDHTTLELIEGVKIDKGYASTYFITNSTKENTELISPLIYITNAKLRNPSDVIPLMEKAAALNKPLFIIADEIEQQALQLLVINKVRGVLQVAAIAAPSYGESRYEILKDLCALTSSTYVTETTTIPSDIPLHFFGTAEKVIVSRSSTILVNPKKSPAEVAQRVEIISSALTPELDSYMEQKTRKRLADLTASVAVIKVGAPTETEQKERKDRVDDALRATVSALAEGFVPGGGTTLARISTLLPSDSEIDIAFKKALLSPLRTILENASQDSDVIIPKILESKDPSYGYNAATSTFSSLTEEGIIDPTLVLRQALTNAVSAANMLLLSSTIIHEDPSFVPYTPPPIDGFGS